MKRFLCFVLVMLMCLGGQALATPQWQNAEPVKAEDLPEGVREGLLEMNPNANTLTLLVWQPLEEQQTQHVPEPSKDYATITTTVTQEQVPLACFARARLVLLFNLTLFLLFTLKNATV